jgi:hypothetical protein
MAGAFGLFRIGGDGSSLGDWRSCSVKSAEVGQFLSEMTVISISILATSLE